MTTANIPLRANRGAAVRVQLRLSVDLTGRSVEVFDISRGVVGNIAATITDATAGKAGVLVGGGEPVPVGKHSWRIRFVGEGLDAIALPRFILEIV